MYIYINISKPGYVSLAAGVSPKALSIYMYTYIYTYMNMCVSRSTEIDS